MEQITSFISENPGSIGLFFVAVGALILVGAILKWQWIVGSNSGRVRTDIVGRMIYKIFGRRGFFIFTGAGICLGGILWFVALTFLT